MLIAGIALLTVSSFVQGYCSFGNDPINTPHVLRSSAAKYINVGWLVMLVVGAIFLFLTSWVYGLIALLLYFFVSPFITMPILRRFF